MLFRQRTQAICESLWPNYCGPLVTSSARIAAIAGAPAQVPTSGERPNRLSSPKIREDNPRQPLCLSSINTGSGLA
jgi:hypothetical protein